MTDAIAASALTTEELPLLFANEQLLLLLVVPLKPHPDLPEEQKDTSHSCMYIINKYIIVVLYCICIMLCTWEDTAMVDTGKLLIPVLLLMVYITKHTKLEEKNEANRAAGKKRGDEQM